MKTLASLAGQQLEAEGMSLPHTDPQCRGQGGLPSPGPSPGTGLSGNRHCPATPMALTRDALIEQWHSSSLDLIHTCWVLCSSAQECDCRVEITAAGERKVWKWTSCQGLFHIHPAAMDFAIGLWIPGNRVNASWCLMGYKPEKKHFYLYEVWLCFSHFNRHHIFLTASLESLIWRGSQDQHLQAQSLGSKAQLPAPVHIGVMDVTSLSWVRQWEGSSFMPSTCTWNSLSQDGHKPSSETLLNTQPAL